MPIPEKLLNGVRREYQIHHLVDMPAIEPTQPGERCLMGLVLPPWQREEVWTTAQQIRFCEGIFLGLGTGYYVTNAPDWGNDGKPLPMSGWLLDGQQRITAIRDFLQDAFPVFGNVLYSRIDPVKALRRFLRQPFPRFEIEYTADENLLKELYRRLNFGGTPHTEQDRARLSRSVPVVAHG